METKEPLAIIQDLGYLDIMWRKLNEMVCPHPFYYQNPDFLRILMGKNKLID
jgi:hypothetical protein